MDGQHKRLLRLLGLWNPKHSSPAIDRIGGMMLGRAILTRFGKNRDGVAAVEFAIVSVVMAGLVVAMAEGWQLAAQQTATQNAVSTGAMYYLQGGASDTAARDFALSSWANRPSNADISIQRSC